MEEPQPDEPDWRTGERIERVVITLPARAAKVLKIWYVIRPMLLREGAMLHPDEVTWAYRRAHVGSAERFLELLADAEERVGGLM